MNFSFQVDNEYARQNNELLKDTRRLQLSALIFGILQFAIGAGFYFWLQGGMGLIILFVFGILGLISFAMIPIIPKQVGKPQQLYDAYELAPAVIAKVNPRDIVLLALVNMNQDGSLPPRWGLAARTVTNLEQHERTVGEKVPSVAVTGQRSARNTSTWDQITPMPIAWGTPDPAVVKRAQKAIPHDQWQKLEKNMDKLEAVRKTKFDLMELR
ncbi:DUF3239 domain-containing protein [Corynebacterium gerontici]|uniref:DUF3239 domain-containing protein n=1 Tax=Corynebacterium gerontici TaxID=2079234 RepID=A0A3G6J3H9_9CORY|nr:DUF3239 domain-containing protein [Corynebacterium gerontici]AZA10960.1 hypothetical protein CGERO_03200 [Corynebacterium gerontici]